MIGSGRSRLRGSSGEQVGTRTRAPETARGERRLRFPAAQPPRSANHSGPVRSGAGTNKPPGTGRAGRRSSSRRCPPGREAGLERAVDVEARQGGLDDERGRGGMSVADSLGGHPRRRTGRARAPTRRPAPPVARSARATPGQRHAARPRPPTRWPWLRAVLWLTHHKLTAERLDRLVVVEEPDLDEPVLLGAGSSQRRTHRRRFPSLVLEQGIGLDAGRSTSLNPYTRVSRGEDGKAGRAVAGVEAAGHGLPMVVALGAAPASLP